VRPEGDGPVEVRFMFENQERRTFGAGTASLLAHAAFIGLCVLIAQLLPEQVYETIIPDRLTNVVWLATPGPGGGGGGGNKSPEPPKKAELKPPEKVAVPVKPPEPIPQPPKEEPPVLELNIPAQTLAAATTVPGAIESTQASTDSRGSGTGTGAGPGQGSGLGPGFGGGTGGGAFQPGSGVTTPVPIREVKPQYTAEAMRARVQGTVWVQCIVMPDGTVGNVEVVRSLDSSFGLDQEAVKAAKQWRFRPGMRFGEPVPVLVTIELTFTLR
jgi:protein TonB